MYERSEHECVYSRWRTRCCDFRVQKVKIYDGKWLSASFTSHSFSKSAPYVDISFSPCITCLVNYVEWASIFFYTRRGNIVLILCTRRFKYKYIFEFSSQSVYLQDFSPMWHPQANLNFVINARRYIYCVYFCVVYLVRTQTFAFTELIAIVKD